MVEDYAPEDGPLFRCAYHKINDSDMPSDYQVVHGRCATGVFHSLLEKIGMEHSKVKKNYNYSGAKFFGLALKDVGAPNVSTLCKKHAPLSREHTFSSDDW